MHSHTYIAYYVADIYLCFKNCAHCFVDVVVGPEQSQSGLTAEQSLSLVLKMIDTALFHVSTSGK